MGPTGPTGPTGFIYTGTTGYWFTFGVQTITMTGTTDAIPFTVTVTGSIPSSGPLLLQNFYSTPSPIQFVELYPGPTGTISLTAFPVPGYENTDFNATITYLSALP
jgi:hypothetical protein